MSATSSRPRHTPSATVKMTLVPPTKAVPDARVLIVDREGRHRTLRKASRRDLRLLSNPLARYFRGQWVGGEWRVGGPMRGRTAQLTW